MNSRPLRYDLVGRKEAISTTKLELPLSKYQQQKQHNFRVTKPINATTLPFELKKVKNPEIRLKSTNKQKDNNDFCIKEEIVVAFLMEKVKIKLANYYGESTLNENLRLLEEVMKKHLDEGNTHDFAIHKIPFISDGTGERESWINDCLNPLLWNITDFNDIEAYPGTFFEHDVEEILNRDQETLYRWNHDLQTHIQYLEEKGPKLKQFFLRAVEKMEKINSKVVQSNWRCQLDNIYSDNLNPGDVETLVNHRVNFAKHTSQMSKSTKEMGLKLTNALFGHFPIVKKQLKGKEIRKLLRLHIDDGVYGRGTKEEESKYLEKIRPYLKESEDGSGSIFTTSFSQASTEELSSKLQEVDDVVILDYNQSVEEDYLDFKANWEANSLLVTFELMWDAVCKKVKEDPKSTFTQKEWHSLRFEELSSGEKLIFWIACLSFMFLPTESNWIFEQPIVDIGGKEKDTVVPASFPERKNGRIREIDPNQRTLPGDILQLEFFEPADIEALKEAAIGTLLAKNNITNLKFDSTDNKFGNMIGEIADELNTRETSSREIRALKSIESISNKLASLQGFDTNSLFVSSNYSVGILSLLEYDHIRQVVRDLSSYFHEEEEGLDGVILDIAPVSEVTNGKNHGKTNERWKKFIIEKFDAAIQRIQEVGGDTDFNTGEEALVELNRRKKELNKLNNSDTTDIENWENAGTSYFKPFAMLVKEDWEKNRKKSWKIPINVSILATIHNIHESDFKDAYFGINPKNDTTTLDEIMKKFKNLRGNQVNREFFAKVYVNASLLLQQDYITTVWREPIQNYYRTRIEELGKRTKIIPNWFPKLNTACCAIAAAGAGVCMYAGQRWLDQGLNYLSNHIFGWAEQESEQESIILPNEESTNEIISPVNGNLELFNTCNLNGTSTEVAKNSAIFQYFTSDQANYLKEPNTYELYNNAQYSKQIVANFDFIYGEKSTAYRILNDVNPDKAAELKTNYQQFSTIGGSSEDIWNRHTHKNAYKDERAWKNRDVHLKKCYEIVSEFVIPEEFKQNYKPTIFEPELSVKLHSPNLYRLSEHNVNYWKNVASEGGILSNIKETSQSFTNAIFNFGPLQSISKRVDFNDREFNIAGNSEILREKSPFLKLIHSPNLIVKQDAISGVYIKNYYKYLNVDQDAKHFFLPYANTEYEISPTKGRIKKGTNTKEKEEEKRLRKMLKANRSFRASRVINMLMPILTAGNCVSGLISTISQAICFTAIPEACKWAFNRCNIKAWNDQKIKRPWKSTVLATIASCATLMYLPLHVQFYGLAIDTIINQSYLWLLMNSINSLPNSTWEQTLSTVVPNLIVTSSLLFGIKAEIRNFKRAAVKIYNHQRRLEEDFKMAASVAEVQWSARTIGGVAFELIKTSGLLHLSMFMSMFLAETNAWKSRNYQQEYGYEFAYPNIPGYMLPSQSSIGQNLAPEMFHYLPTGNSWMVAWVWYCMKIAFMEEKCNLEHKHIARHKAGGSTMETTEFMNEYFVRGGLGSIASKIFPESRVQLTNKSLVELEYAIKQLHELRVKLATLKHNEDEIPIDKEKYNEINEKRRDLDHRICQAIETDYLNYNQVCRLFEVISQWLIVGTFRKVFINQYIYDEYDSNHIKNLAQTNPKNLGFFFNPFSNNSNSEKNLYNQAKNALPYFSLRAQGEKVAGWAIHTNTTANTLMEGNNSIFSDYYDAISMLSFHASSNSTISLITVAVAAASESHALFSLWFNVKSQWKFYLGEKEKELERKNLAINSNNLKSYFNNRALNSRK